MDGFDVAAWLDLLSQDTRFITLDTPAADGLIVERLEGREAVSDDFRFTLDCLSASAFLDLKPLVGAAIRVSLATASGGRRAWHGYVTHAAALGADGGLARYRLVMESGLAFLRLRRNTLIFQDKTALEVIGQVFGDHPELRWRNDSTATLRTRPVCTQYRETDAEFVRRLLGEEGLSFRFEHDQDAGGDGPGHTLVIFDPAASQSLPAGDPATIRFHRVDATEVEDAITLFSERRQVVPDQLATASWASDQVQSVSGGAQAEAGEGPELPALDVFDADRAHRFDSAEQANRYAANRLDALRLHARTFPGQGAVRTLEAGKAYTLSGHPDLTGQAFVPLWVEHRATNNLSTGLPHLLGQPSDDALGKGSYRNTFLAIPSGTRIAPDHRDKPLAPGCSSALVVGVPGHALTGTRDHQVRIQFFWQRGVAPLPGGLTDTSSISNPAGHAPGDDRSGTWVRVAEANAGAHHGHSFVPRIGDEVLVEYAHGDIDQPVVVGTLYNGPATPPFAAGEGSGANHPGTLSGLQTQTLDGQPGSRWVLDDASGQLRHSLGHTLAESQLALGYLIDQQGNQRGAYRGEGFELMTTGWTVVRAGEGLLVSSTARPRGQSTQMDSAEALGQLKAAAATAQRLNTAALQATATPLAAADPAHANLQQTIDPRWDGKYHGAVNGQPATQPTGTQRSGGDPVERFAQPALLLETPASLAMTTPNSAAAFAGGHLHLTSQRDTHLAAGTTLSTVAGDAVGLYAADGGMKIIANRGPVSLEAHTDALQILADQSVTVTSTTDRIDVLAQDRIVLQAGQSTITLDGPNITIACPGNFTVKSGTHDWLDGENQAAQLPALPVGEPATGTLYLDHRYHDDQGLSGATYFATFPDGSKKQGTLNGQGRAAVTGVPVGGAQVSFSPMPEVFARKDKTPTPDYDPSPSNAKLRKLVAKYYQPAPSDSDGTTT